MFPAALLRTSATIVLRQLPRTSRSQLEPLARITSDLEPLTSMFSLWQPLSSFPTAPYSSNQGEDLHWQEYNVAGDLSNDKLEKLQQEVNKALTEGDKEQAVGFTFHSHRSTVNGKTSTQTNFSVGKEKDWTPEERQAMETKLLAAVGEKAGLHRIENVRQDVPIAKAIEGSKSKK